MAFDNACFKAPEDRDRSRVAQVSRSPVFQQTAHRSMPPLDRIPAIFHAHARSRNILQAPRELRQGALEGKSKNGENRSSSSAPRESKCQSSHSSLSNSNNAITSAKNSRETCVHVSLLRLIYKKMNLIRCISHIRKFQDMQGQLLYCTYNCDNQYRISQPVCARFFFRNK